MSEQNVAPGLRAAIQAVKRIRKDYLTPGERGAYAQGVRDALAEVERVCRKEIEFAKESER